MPATCTIGLVDYGTPLYDLTKKFREDILRRPLGLILSADDLAGEEDQLHIAAIEGGDVIRGTVLLKPLSDRTVRLRQMAVDPSVQKAGLGKRLVAFAEDAARAGNCREITMVARLSALGFYQKLGYDTQGDGFIEATVPSITMRKTL